MMIPQLINSLKCIYSGSYNDDSTTEQELLIYSHVSYFGIGHVIFGSNPEINCLLRVRVTLFSF